MDSDLQPPPPPPSTSSAFSLTKPLLLAAISASLLLILAAAAAAAFLLLFRRRHRRAAAARVKHESGAILPAASSSIQIGSIRTVHRDRLGTTVSVNTSDQESIKKSEGSASSTTTNTTNSCYSESMMIGWGRWYGIEDLEIATEGFNEKCIIGKGGYGIVYRGVLPDQSVVAVKNLFDNKGQAEREFKVEVEAIGKVRHKNLVGLIGYCAEGPKRMLVYEYVENGNLEEWLHGEIGRSNPLSWDTRMQIAIGTAKGIAHLHEGLEPKVVHRDIKSSNILLDKNWNPKVSDFGLAKLLGPGSSYVTTRVMGTFGYVAPEYASTGILSEGSDIYSFGVLLMEIITGRSPVDYNRPPGEVNLVEWFKGMVGSRRIEDLIDPQINVQPSPRALKRVLLVCLRCIDSEAQKRPKMGQLVHMLEGDEFPFRMEHRSPRENNLNASRVVVSRSPLLSEKIGVDDLERSMWR